ncbi:c-type cytochrome [Lichenibacterium minor]|nr:c-type cytochrome [Lichenibacterium minor]
MKHAMTLAAVGTAAVAVVAVAVTLAPAPERAPPRSAPTEIGGRPDPGRSADAGRGATVFRACSACHTIGRGGADVDGPNLYGVVGARVAERRPRYGYTQALRDSGGTWTEARLDAWLTDPAAFAPGTAMHFPGLPDAGERADVIAYLGAQGPARR